jgi:asparagine synthase (glutamine-hydrolysing)
MVDTPCEFSPDLVLGHRRLAIIDLSPGGHEPMTIQGGHLWITYNGEIYNYVEIRDELRAKGCDFHTESDVEVLLHAYKEWGIDCLHRFIGMFAFALWDQDKRRLWCVRDRMGIKPFYYAANADSFAFASEIKALRILAPDAYQPDMEQLAWFLHFGLIYNAPNTFFTGIRELPAGHYLLVEDGKVTEPIRWWNVDLERAYAIYNYSDIEGEFLRLMQDSIKLRLRSDVPVGTCLSGGLDSSTIVALATRQLNGGRMNSFSAVYPVKGLDETGYVDLVSQQYGTIKHKTTPNPDQFLERMRKITWHQDIPTGSSGVYTQNFVMELAHGNVTVLLDGQGADELFAGYLNYVVHYLSDLRKRSPVRWVNEQAMFLLGVWPRFNSSLTLREFATRAFYYLQVGRKPLNYINSEFAQLAQARQQMQPVIALEGADSLNNFLYRSLVQDSIPGLLHYEDRNSMAYGIEARVPFLDHRMVEFALGIPAEMKIRGPETKVVMRKALKSVLPKAITQRKDKLGYPTPLAQWLRGPLLESVNTYLNDAVFKRSWYNVERLKELWKQHQQEQRNAEQIIYRVITAELWYQDVTQTSA